MNLFKKDKKELVVQGKRELMRMDETMISKLVLKGDLSAMTPQEKVSYYNLFCHNLGLNPATQPFQIIKFQGKEKLYASKDATEQLRKINGVSIYDMKTEQTGDIYKVIVYGMDREGRKDMGTGVVKIGGLTGDNLANAIMKAETKAKRRFTLSICGLGILDESELDTMPPHTTHDVTPQPKAIDKSEPKRELDAPKAKSIKEETRLPSWRDRTAGETSYEEYKEAKEKVIEENYNRIDPILPDKPKDKPQTQDKPTQSNFSAIIALVNGQGIPNEDKVKILSAARACNKDEEELAIVLKNVKGDYNL